MNNWKEIDQKLQEHLRLRTLPLAFTFLEGKSELEKIDKLRRPKHQIFFCQMVTTARTFGMTMGAVEEDFYSPACAGMLGLSERPDYVMDGRFKGVFWVEHQKDGQKCESLFPTIPGKKGKAVALAPLKQGKFDPELVLLYGTPAQMIIAVNALQWKDYQVMQFHCVGEGACSDLFARCYVEKKPQLSLPCYGERTYGHVAEDELAMALPAESVGKIIEGLEGLAGKGIRYPIPPAGALADMRPAIPKAYLEMWKDRIRK